MLSWVNVTRGDAPLIVSMPHSGHELAPEMEWQLVSRWLARKDTDWHLEKLYDFAPELGVTVIRNTLSRTVIDVNRDPSEKPPLPGQTTNELCPTTTLDGEPLYRDGQEPKAPEIARRRAAYFDPYHRVLAEEIARLRSLHGRIILFDAHAMRSSIPRLFKGRLPDFNIGTNDGRSCDPAVTAVVEDICDPTGFLRVTNERSKGGLIVRHYGNPDEGVHALQLALSCRIYLHEPDEEHWGSHKQYDRETWPPPYDKGYASAVRQALYNILESCIALANAP